MALDKPNINLTIAELEAEVGNPEAFVMALKGGKRVTFPDIFAMPAQKAMEFLEELKGATNDFTALKKWLTADDYAKYEEAGLSLRLHSALIERVQAYYEQTVGKPGEGNASAS